MLRITIRMTLVLLLTVSLGCDLLPFGKKKKKSSGSSGDRIVTLSFTGEYGSEAGPANVYGEIFDDTDTRVPFEYTLEYDTSLDESDAYYEEGEMIGTEPAAHDWYGYSASGIVSANMTFGTKTFPVDSLTPWDIPGDTQADLWFNRDLADEIPTRSAIRFIDPQMDYDDDLMLGVPTSDTSGYFMNQVSEIETEGPVEITSDSVTIEEAAE